MLSIRDAANRELEARPNLLRKQKRYIRRQIRAQQYAAVARAGGGEGERDRRCRQMAKLSDHPLNLVAV